MKKFLVTVLLTIYAVIAIATTICLLSYNSYHVSQFGKTSLIIIDSNDLEDKGLNMGDIVFVTSSKNIKANDLVFVYDNSTTNEVSITLNTIKEVNTNSRTNETTYKMDNGETYYSSSIIGPFKENKILPKLGMILKALESKFGYLFLVVLPTLLLFLYELYTIVIQIKNGSDDEESDDEYEERPKKKTTSRTKKTSTKSSSSRSSTTKSKKRVTKKSNN